MIQSTSKIAFQKIQPTLNARQNQVLDAIVKLGVASNQQIAEFLGWQINKVTPRTLELRHAGKVCAAGYEKNKSGFTVAVWRKHFCETLF